MAYDHDFESASKATFDLLTSKQIMHGLHHHDMKMMQASKAKAYMGICMCKPHPTTGPANSPSMIDFDSNSDTPGASASAILASVKTRVRRLHDMIQSNRQACKQSGVACIHAYKLHVLNVKAIDLSTPAATTKTTHASTS